MKRLTALCAVILVLVLVFASAASAADWYGEPAKTCYPTSVTRSEDGAEIKKIYDLSPEDDPLGIPRSDFEQDGFHYSLTDLLKQELPEQESRRHTETVSLESKSKDMASVLALLPQEREFVTEDGLAGTLSLQLDTVQVEVSGYGSATKTVSATRTYPNLLSQDTQYIPKTIEDSGHTLTLQDIHWQTDSADRYTASATYTGNTTSSYVKGYTITADYVGTVSRIALNKTRYVTVFEGTPIQPLLPVMDTKDHTPTFRLAYLLVPLGVVALAGAGVGAALFIRRRNEEDEVEA